MIIQVFTIWDAKSEVFMQPFYSHNVGTAIRSIQETMRDPNSMFAKYPEDFMLYQLGAYDDQLGKFELGNPKLLGHIHEYKQQEPS